MLPPSSKQEQKVEQNSETSGKAGSAESDASDEGELVDDRIWPLHHVETASPSQMEVLYQLLSHNR